MGRKCNTLRFRRGSGTEKPESLSESAATTPSGRASFFISVPRPGLADSLLGLSLDGIFLSMSKMAGRRSTGTLCIWITLAALAGRPRSTEERATLSPQRCSSRWLARKASPPSCPVFRVIVWRARSHDWVSEAWVVACSHTAGVGTH